MEPRRARFNIPPGLRKYQTDQPPPAYSGVESDVERQERLRASREQSVQRFLASIPPLYANATMDTVDDEVQSQIADWWATTSPTLLLSGPPDSGKTHSAIAAARWITEHAPTTTVHMIKVAQFLRTSLSLYSGRLSPAETDEARQDEIAARDCDVLIMDDLGADNATNWARERLTALLDARLDYQRRQIVTTNLPLLGNTATDDALANRLDLRGLSRLTAGMQRIEMRHIGKRRGN